MTDARGPAQVQGSVGSRSPYDVSAAGSSQSLAEVLRLARLGDLEPARRSSSAARSERTWTSSTAGPGPRCTCVEPPWNAGDAVGPEPAEQVGVVAVAEERLGVGAHEVGVQVRDHRDLVVAADGGQDGPDLRVAERRVEVGRPVARGVASSRRVVGYSTGTSPVTSCSRRMACSCTAGATAGAANDGETHGDLVAGCGLGGAQELVAHSASQPRRRPTGTAD